MSKYPLIKFTILFISGICLTELFHFQPLYPGIIFTLSISSGLLLLFYKRYCNPRFSILPVLNFFAIIAIISAGILYSYFLNEDKAEYPFEKYRIEDAIIEGELCGKELPKEKYFDLYVKSNKTIVGIDTTFESIKYLCKVKRQTYKDIPFEIGSVVRVKGNIQKARERRNPFEFDYNNYLNSKGISALFYVTNLSDISLIQPIAFSPENWIYSARISIGEKISKMYAEETASLLKGLLLADRSGIDFDTKQSFVNAGVIHVLAVSGLHVGYITVIFLFLFSRFNIYFKNIFTILGLLLFVLITGAPASVVRASIMAGALIFSTFSARQFNSFNSLALAALVILIFDPSELFNAGFQLSFSAVLSIFIIYPIIRKWISNLGNINKNIKGILLFMGVSFAAQIGTLPFTMLYFNKLSVISLFANLFVIPLIGVIVSLGITSLVFGFLWTFVGILYANANEIASVSLFAIVNTMGRWEYSHLFIPQFSLYDGLIFYLSLGIMFYIFKRIHSITARVIAVILLIAGAVFSTQLDNTEELLSNNVLSVMMIDVGQGDSFLIKFPNGKTALIDAGNANEFFDNGERVIFPLLKNLGINKINYGFVSHVDADHYKGFEFLVRSGIVDTIYKPACDSTKKLDVEFENLVRSKNIPFMYYQQKIISVAGTNIYILNQSSAFANRELTSNDMSGIIKIVCGEKSFLFVGDAGKSVESELVEKYGKFLNSNVLKVGHHGSHTSTGDEFLNTVSPEISLVSVGLFNSFNHPSQEVITKLKSYDTQVLRTDLNRAVILQTDGNNLWQKLWK